MSFHSRLSASLLSAALALVAVVVHAGTNSWTVKGPPGGHALGVQAHTTAPNVFYAMFARSLHRSTDGGATWTLLRHFEGQVNSLAIDPSDGNRIYVAVYDEGLYRSENRGDSFTLVAPPGAGIWAVGANATAVYYSTNDRRVIRSVDRGSSWTVRGQASQTLTKILVDPQNADLLLASIGPYALISSDGGTNWTQVQVSASAFMWLRDIAQLSATQFIASASDGIYFSSDRGATWTRSFSGEYISLAVDRMTPGRAVAALWSSGNVAETTNYGATWQSIGPWIDGRPEGIAIDSQSSSRYVLIGGQFVRHSTSLAQPWIEATQGPIAQEVSQFATTSASNAKVYALATTARVGAAGCSRPAATTVGNGSSFQARAQSWVKPSSPSGPANRTASTSAAISKCIVPPTVASPGSGPVRV